MSPLFIYLLFFFLKYIQFAVCTSNEPPYMMRASVLSNKNINDTSYGSIFGNRETFEDNSRSEYFEKADYIVSYIMNDTKPRLFAMTSSFWIDETIDTSQNSFKNNLNSNSSYILDGMNESSDPNNFIKCTYSINIDDNSFNATSSEYESLILSVYHMENTLSALNNHYSSPIITNCRYLWHTNLFILDVVKTQDLEKVQNYIFDIWETNHQIWLLEADSFLKFRLDDEEQKENDEIRENTKYIKSINHLCMNKSDQSEFSANFKNLIDNNNLMCLVNDDKLENSINYDFSFHNSSWSDQYNKKSILREETDSSSNVVLDTNNDFLNSEDNSKNEPDEPRYVPLLSPFMNNINDFISNLFNQNTFKAREVNEKFLIDSNIISDLIPTQLRQSNFQQFLSNFFNFPTLFTQNNANNDNTNRQNGNEPNDKYFQRQWGLYNSIQNIDVDALKAWDIYNKETDKRKTIVAHIDTGIDLNHPDLQGRLWTNTKEIPNDNIDNDNNGYVDDIHGWNFVHNNNDLTDISGHGTHTAGIIGATINNGNGIAGLAVDVELMALKILNKASEAVEAIEYSISKGAKISSNSWGFVVPIKSLKLVLDKAERSGQLFVCAVDNRGKDNTINNDFPANWGPGNGNTGLNTNFNIFRVASLQRDGNLASSSNYGKNNVDIAAPGHDILSTVPKRIYGGDYAYKSGTSMATPFVAATAALMNSLYPMSYMELRNNLLNSAVKLPNLKNLLISEGTLNSARALEITKLKKNQNQQYALKSSR